MKYQNDMIIISD